MLGSLSISKHFGIGIVVMLILLVTVVITASIGIDQVVNSAKYLLESNKLRSAFMEHEIDHLEWEDELYTFLTDRRVEKLQIPLDEKQCKFGLWLYGEERKQSEIRLPALIPMFKELEEPHGLLHKSAQKIQAKFRRSDRELPKFLLEQMMGYLQWLVFLGNTVDEQRELNQNADENILESNQANLERQLSERYKLQVGQYKNYELMWVKILQAHTDMRESVQRMLGQMRKNNNLTTSDKQSQSPKNTFFAEVLPNLQQLLNHLMVLKSIATQEVQAEEQADEILRNESFPNHALLQHGMHKIRALVDETMVTDEKMLVLAQSTRRLIIIIGILALVLAALIATRIARSIVKPLNELTKLLATNCNDIKVSMNSVFDYSKNNDFTNKLSINDLSGWVRTFKMLHFWTSRHWHLPSGIEAKWYKQIKNKNIALKDYAAVSIANCTDNVKYPDMPAEVASLVQAVNRYAQCHTNMIREQQRFIANMAHQLKNPVAGIYIQIDMLVDDVNKQSATQVIIQRDQIIKLQASIHRVGRLIHQLLALARCSPEAVDHQEMRPVDLKNIIEDNASSWFDAALSKKIDLGFEIESTLIYGVAWLVSEMLNNLVDNAVKHTPTNGKITVSCGYHEKFVSGHSRQIPFLKVEDSGPGIPLSQREKVFERFYRTDKTNTIKDDSVGLGLAIVKEVAEYHQAEISIGVPLTAKGTLFSIEFPHSDSRISGP